MEISAHLRCLFSASLEQRDGSYVFEVPKHEIELGGLQDGETYRVAVQAAPTTSAPDDAGTDLESAGTSADPEPTQTRESPPVDAGEQRAVEIESIGDQGDGITRVERGFVVIVPDTEQGERVTVEITDVRQNVAFAEVVERLSYYD
jgi:predicted RNA-binding protein with TRAM domain